jgi:hypothetical protein
MNKLTTILALLIAAGALSAQGRFAGGLGRGGPGAGFGQMAWSGAEARVSGAPYSGVRTTLVQQTLANGNQITRQVQAKVYRDSQGRVRIEQTSTNAVTGQTRTSVTITDPVAGVSYLLNPEAKTYARTPARMFARPAARTSDGSGSTAGVRRGRAGTEAQPGVGGRARGGAQTQTEDLGTQSIEGQPATGRRMTETIPAGGIGNQQPIQVVRETWISTTLHIPVMIKTSDPRFGVTSMQLSNVVTAEPDASLFAPPADYTLAGGRGARTAARGPAAQ